MATKYILDTNGNIRRINREGKISESKDPSSKDPSDLPIFNNEDEPNLNKSTTKYYREANRFINPTKDLDISKVDIQDGFGSESDDFSNIEGGNAYSILTQMRGIESFGFIDKDGNKKEEANIEPVTIFKPFNTFKDYDPEEGNKPQWERIFADEFEILTGFAGSDETDSIVDNDGIPVNLGALVFNYIAEVTARLTVIEGIIAANSVINNYVSGPRNDVIEKSTLRIGKYDFNEFDIFTKYIFNILNYPHENSSIIERVTAFFVGFTQWIAPDSIIDLDAILQEIKGDFNRQNSLDLTSFEPKNVVLDQLLVLTSSAIDLLITSINNSSAKKRIKLLLRKFYQERYWKSKLYDAKVKQSPFEFFSDYNYYYMRFYIERVQVGLPILKKYFYDDTYLQLRQPESPTNRVSASRSRNNEQSITPKIKGNNYNWAGFRSNNPIGTKPGDTTRLRALPQAFILNANMYKAIGMNNKSTFDISDDLDQNFVKVDSNTKRISSDLVKEIENNLEAEYMPFYFHDLRTNEIISFHAFIESISDSFSPEYNSSSGFGRIDDVKSYVKTTRNINLTFVLAATSPSDHDLMWWQINKIVAMVYPQWSGGNKTESGEFTYPFTQVPTSSPLIRLRIGDVIKSNYSRTNLGRIHGVEKNYTSNILSDEDLLNENFQEDFQVFSPDDDLKKSLSELEVQIKKNNEIIEKSKNNALKIKPKTENKFLKEQYNKLVGKIDASSIRNRYLRPGLYKTTNMSSGLGGLLDAAGIDLDLNPSSVRIDTEVEIIKIEKVNITNEYVKVKIKSPFDNSKEIALAVDASKVIEVNPKQLYGKASDNAIYNPITGSVTLPDRNQESLKAIEYTYGQFKKIMSPTDENKANNPITKSYESGMSRGLAGFITNLDVNYNESTWDTERIGSKAPIMVKINIGFSPIHDIPPGLDSNGMLRAPIYNVGKINNEFFGDPHDGDEGHGKGREEALKKYYTLINTKPFK